MCEEDDEWFCWRCETLDDVLDHVNDALGTQFTENNLFPELDGGPHALQGFQGEDDDEDDEEYLPCELSEEEDGEQGDGAEGDENEGDNDRKSSSEVVDGEGSGTDTDSDDSGDDESMDSAISEGELQGLVAENTDTLPDSSGKRYGTRTRRPAGGEARNPDEFIGQMVVRVHMGEAEFGNIFEVASRPGLDVSSADPVDVPTPTPAPSSGDTLTDLTQYSWSALFDDEVVVMCYEELKQAIEVYSQVEGGYLVLVGGKWQRNASQTRGEKRKNKELDDRQDEGIDLSNVVPHSRQKRTVDYVALSQMVCNDTFWSSFKHNFTPKLIILDVRRCRRK